MKIKYLKENDIYYDKANYPTMDDLANYLNDELPSEYYCVYDKLVVSPELSFISIRDTKFIQVKKKSTDFNIINLSEEDVSSIGNFEEIRDYVLNSIAEYERNNKNKSLLTKLESLEEELNSIKEKIEGSHDIESNQQNISELYIPTDEERARSRKIDEGADALIDIILEELKVFANDHKVSFEEVKNDLSDVLHKSPLPRDLIEIIVSASEDKA